MSCLLDVPPSDLRFKGLEMVMKWDLVTSYVDTIKLYAKFRCAASDNSL